MGLFDTFRNGGGTRQWIRENLPQNLRQDVRNIVSGDTGQKVAGAAGIVGSVLGLPDLGVSEVAGKSQVYDNAGNVINRPQDTTSQQPGTTNAGQDVGGANGANQAVGGSGSGSSGSGGNGQGIPSQQVIDQLGGIKDSMMAALDKQLGNLKDYGVNMESQINDLFGLQNADLDTQFNSQQNELGVATQRANDWRAKSISDLTNDVKNLLEAGNTRLGSAGAGSSSASGMYNYAVTKSANKNRADILSKAGQMLQDLNLKAGEIKSNYDSEKRKIVNWKNSTLLNLANEIRDKKEQIEMAKVNADAQTREAIAQYESQFSNDVLGKLQTLDKQTQIGLSTLDDWFTGWNDNINKSASSLKTNIQKFQAADVNMPTAQQFNPTVETNASAPGSGMLVPWWNAEEKKDNQPALA